MVQENNESFVISRGIAGTDQSDVTVSSVLGPPDSAQVVTYASGRSIVHVVGHNPSRGISVAYGRLGYSPLAVRRYRTETEPLQYRF